MKTYETGLFSDIEESKKAYDKGEVPWSISYHFMPDELKGILEKNGVKNIRLAGPGAFARTIPNEILVKIMNDPAQRRDFLDFCQVFKPGDAIFIINSIFGGTGAAGFPLLLKNLRLS